MQGGVLEGEEVVGGAERGGVKGEGLQTQTHTKSKSFLR